MVVVQISEETHQANAILMNLPNKNFDKTCGC